MSHTYYNELYLPVSYIYFSSYIRTMNYTYYFLRCVRTMNYTYYNESYLFDGRPHILLDLYLPSELYLLLKLYYN